MAVEVKCIVTDAGRESFLALIRYSTLYFAVQAEYSASSSAFPLSSHRKAPTGPMACSHCVAADVMIKRMILLGSQGKRWSLTHTSGHA